MADPAANVKMPARVQRRRTCRRHRLAALLAAALLVATAAPAFSQPPKASRTPDRPSPGRSNTPFEPAKRTPQALQKTIEPSKPSQAPSWFQRLFGGGSSESGEVSQEVGLGDLSKLLMAMGSVVGAASLADSAGLIYAADVLDVLDAQALLTEGQVEAGSVNMDDNLVNLQLMLEDGNKRIITLFAK